jgi:outer membrane protein OmpA-like peptidoglycan-associated protein
VIILQQVNFATNSDRIVGRPSFQVLDAVVSVLTQHPEIPAVEVQGHTDNRGNPATNRTLSERRANAVRTYLTNHGIAAARLRARGFGPDAPLESNATPAGRTRNRRVEFHIVPAAPAPGAVGATAPSS